MDMKQIMKLATPAAGAYLGVRASELLGRGGLIGAALGIAGAALGLYLAGQVAR